MNIQLTVIKRIITISILAIATLTFLSQTTPTPQSELGTQLLREARGFQPNSESQYALEFRQTLSEMVKYSQKLNESLDESRGYSGYIEAYNAKKYALLQRQENAQVQYAGRDANTYIPSRSSNVEVLYADANMPLADGSHYFYEGNCTRYVASNTTIPWGGNAGTWLDGAKSYGYEVKDTPEAGDIFVSNESSYGHTGIVKEVDYDKGVMVVEEMNYEGYGVVSKREVPLGSNKMKGFINPDKEDTTTVEETVSEEQNTDTPPETASSTNAEDASGSSEG